MVARNTGQRGAISSSKRRTTAAKPRSASLVRRASARSPEALKRRWAEVVARRKRFAEWLAQRHTARQNKSQGDQ
jgi:hypothetical protein